MTTTTDTSPHPLVASGLIALHTPYRGGRCWPHIQADHQGSSDWRLMCTSCGELDKATGKPIDGRWAVDAALTRVTQKHQSYLQRHRLHDSTATHVWVEATATTVEYHCASCGELDATTGKPVVEAVQS